MFMYKMYYHFLLTGYDEFDTSKIEIAQYILYVIGKVYLRIRDQNNVSILIMTKIIPMHKNIL